MDTDGEEPRIEAVPTPRTGNDGGLRFRPPVPSAPDQRRVDVRDRGATAQRHGDLKLAAENVDDARDTPRAIDRQAEQVRPADEHGSCAKGDGLEHIGAT